MTPEETGQYFKQTYPGQYDNYPDAVVGQRALLKYPDFASKPSLRPDQSIPDAVEQAILGHLKRTKDELTLQNNGPVDMATALPRVAGAAGAVLPVPMGATMGTAGGHALADAALKSIGREDQIPSIGSQAVDVGLAAAGDVAAFPNMQKYVQGKQIGQLEKAAGVPPVQDIPSLPRPKIGDPVAGGIDEAIKSVSDAKASGGAVPVYWKQIKDQIDNFYNLGKDVKLTNLDKGKLKWLSAQVQEGLNSAVPGRSAPAGDMARVMTIPNAITDTYKALPSTVRTGLGIGAGTSAIPAIGYALWKALGAKQ